MTTNLIESYFVDAVVFDVKFDISVKTSSITNDRFTLLINSATPSIVSTDPFEDIRIDYDYDSIARRLQLKWKSSSLAASTSYVIKLSGFRSVLGDVIPDTFVYFHTTASETSATPSYILDQPEPVQVIDFSLIPDMFVSSSSDPDEVVLPEKFAFIDSDPVTFDAFLPANYKNGIITLKFNKAPAASELNDDYIFVERKAIQRAPSRWEVVTVTIEQDVTKPWVYIQMPAVTTGVYYDTNYKYRVRISKDLGA